MATMGSNELNDVRAAGGAELAEALVQRLPLQLQAMKQAQERAGVPDAGERRDRLSRLLQLLREQADEFCAALDADYGGGRPRETSLMSDVMATFSSVKYARGQLGKWMKPQRRQGVLPFNLFGARVEVHAQPKGVIGILGTWNVPLFTTLTPLAFVLAAGNRALIKPSEFVPRTSALLQEAIARRFAEDEVAVCTGDARLAAAFSAQPFDHLVFTGSTATGRRVMQAAAANLVPVTLELGGKSPVVIGRSADLQLAAERIVLGKLLNGGQVCVSPDIVHVAAEQLEAFIVACRAAWQRYCPPGSEASLSALIDQRQRSRLQGSLDELSALGVRVENCASSPAVGLDAGERRWPLRLVIAPPAHSRLAQEEIFGPILQLESYQQFDEVIAHINAGSSPLALYYFGRDQAEEQRLLSHTRSGGVAINEVLLQVAAVDAPFGGIGGSGIGRYHGREGFDEFSHARTVYRSGWWDPRAKLGLLPPHPPALYEQLKKTMRL
jgi:coniferyl-aldehyde dehydrogenase